MIKRLASLIGCGLFAAAMTSTHAAAASPSGVRDALSAELAAVGVARFTSAAYRPGPIRHLVLFRYKPDVGMLSRMEVRRRFLALRTKSRRDGKPYIVSIEGGRQISGEELDQGMDDAYIVTFRSEGDRNFYVGRDIVDDPRYIDQAHDAFKQFVVPLLREPVATAGVLVFDFRP